MCSIPMRTSWTWMERRYLTPILSRILTRICLTSVNYICHLFVVKTELLEQVGGFRAGI